MRSAPFRVSSCIVLAGCLAAATPAIATPGGLRIESVTLDGRPLQLPETVGGGTGSPARDQPLLRLPAGDHRLEIRYSAGANSPAADDTHFDRGTRLRHRLDGRDETWQDAPASGRVFVKFYDAAGDVLDSVETCVSGESPGWAGALQRSPFRDYEFAATAPARAVRTTAHFLSHGAERGREVVGQIGIDDVELVITPATGGEPTRHPLPAPQTADDPDALDTPPGWTRQGSWGRMAQVRLGGAPVAHPILAIIDDDPRQFGNWSSTDAVPVKPGDAVKLAWRSAHSLGVGGSAVASYHDLRPGRYWFRAGAFRPAGDPTGDEIGIGFEVVVPWHERPEVLLTGSIIGLGVAAMIGRSVALARIQRRLEEVERAHALERERTRIARDLHDEVGASLTDIAMQQYWIQREMEGIAPPHTLARLERSRQSVVDLVRNVDAIVWAVNPSNDTLDRFVPYLTHSIEQFLEHAGVTARIEVPDAPPPLPLEGSLRHALFLAVREAVNNAVRHGQPTTIWLTVEVRDGERQVWLAISVADDGRGMPPAPAEGAGGLGIDSMRRRVEEAGGRFAIQARPGGGTHVLLEVPLPGDES